MLKVKVLRVQCPYIFFFSSVMKIGLSKNLVHTRYLINVEFSVGKVLDLLFMPSSENGVKIILFSVPFWRSV